MCNDWTKGNDFKQTKSRLRLNIWEKFFTLRVAWRGCGCPVPGGVKYQTGWDFKQPGLVKGVLAELELDDL